MRSGTIATLVLVLSLAACGGTIPGRGPSPATVTVDLATAVGSALSVRPGRAVEAKMKTKDGATSFEVDVLGDDGLVGEVELGADGKAPLGLPWQKRDTPKADPELAAIVPALAVDLGTAIRTALQAAPGVARSADLSTSKGSPQWKVKVWGAAGEAEVRIDAATGQVVPR